MDKGTLAIVIVVIAVTVIAISFGVTLPFIQRYRGKSAEPIVSLRITNLISPYADVYVAIQIAITQPEAKIPLATIFQAVLLVALPVLVILYVR